MGLEKPPCWLSSKVSGERALLTLEKVREENARVSQETCELAYERLVIEVRHAR